VGKSKNFIWLWKLQKYFVKSLKTRNISILIIIIFQNRYWGWVLQETWGSFGHSDAQENNHSAFRKIDSVTLYQLASLLLIQPLQIPANPHIWLNKIKMCSQWNTLIEQSLKYYEPTWPARYPTKKHSTIIWLIAGLNVWLPLITAAFV